MVLYPGIYVTFAYESSSRKIVRMEKYSSEKVELEYTDFIFSALQNTNILYDDYEGLTNFHNATVESDLFIEYVCQFYLHPCFMLNVKKKSFSNLDNVQESSTNLNNANNKNIISESPQPVRRIDACIGSSLIATIEDLLVTRQNTGFLQIKLKNNRAKKRKLEESFESTKENVVVEEVNLDANQIPKDLEELWSACLPEQVELAKAKLKSILSHERAEIKKPQTVHLYNTYNYLFTCPELILYNFHLSYKEVSQHLLEKWSIYQSVIFTAIMRAGKRILYTEVERENDWDSGILSFLNLSRLLPPPPNGNRKISRLTDVHADERLIVHEQTGLTNDEYLENSQNILALGNSKSGISQFMLVLDGHIIALPSTFDYV